ncbi:MAG TPA: hypothetical protein VFP54_04040 [Acidimicrobiales bacterium]|nr:hypothetical protein [Acidimicrobiales bacterium]
MTALAAVIGTLVVLALVLFVTDLAERKVVSGPVLIARVARAPRLSPEYVEAFVTTEAEKMLRGQAMRRL